MAIEQDPAMQSFTSSLISQMAEAEPGASLAMRLVARATEERPDALSPPERTRFLQQLVRLTEREFRRVIEHMGGIEAFCDFLLKEVYRRGDDIDRIAWFASACVDPTAVLNAPLPGSSTMANSNLQCVRFPHMCPLVAPAILRCKAFLKFHEVMRFEALEGTTLLPRWTEFLRASNRVNENDKMGCGAVDPFLRDWIQDIPGVAIWDGQSKRFEDTKLSIDVAFFLPILESWPLMIIEHKSDVHSNTTPKADAVAQATHYYLQQLHASPLQGTFNAPALILQIVGTHASVHAVLHSGHDRNGPAFVGTHLLAEIDMRIDHTQDEQQQQQRKVSTFWLAIKACICEMVQDIAHQLVVDLSRPIRTNWRSEAGWRPAHAFPWITQAGSFRFEYLEALGADKMVFLVRLFDFEDRGSNMVVKFVNHTRYAKEAHELLVCEGLAPRIHHSEEINGEWTMLLMEYMEGMMDVDEFKSHHSLTPTHKEQESRALDILHSAGFVHGDFRNVDVMVNESGRVCIIDFDWSGREESARYPVLINREIHWPPGATANARIEKQHDIWWHARRYSLEAARN